MANTQLPIHLDTPDEREILRARCGHGPIRTPAHAAAAVICVTSGAAG